MELNIASAPLTVSLPRSCARCGNSFRAFRKHYICAACRRPENRPPRRASERLSSREQQIVALIQQAKSNKQIAFELLLTEGTIKEYLYRIFRKTHVTSRTELALRSYRESLVLEATRAKVPLVPGNA